MKKTELFEQFFATRDLRHKMWDGWFEWRTKQAGVKPRDYDKPFEEWDDKDAWNEILRSMPQFFKWWPYADGNVRFVWEGGYEDVPHEMFVDDLDDQPDLEMLWYDAYYDGPLNGMAKYNGKLVWFSLDNYDEGNWVYSLYELSNDEIGTEISHHRLFQEMVGYHSDYDPGVYCEYQGSRESVDEFYEISKTWETTDYTQNKKLGSFPYYQFKY